MLLKVAFSFTNIILISFLFLKKASIDKIIDILYNLLMKLKLIKIVQGNIIMLKRDLLTICNITKAIYCK